MWFGTDGIRGKVGKLPITNDFFTLLGYVIGKLLIEEYKSEVKVLIGQDPRESGEALIASFIKGLGETGITKIHRVGIVPTPALAYLTRENNYHLGCMITASHNLFYDNGIKFFNQEGLKLSDELELAIEEQLQHYLIENTFETTCEPLVEPFDNGLKLYRNFCNKLVAPLSLQGVKLGIDCANGAMYPIAPELFKDLGAEIITLGDQPNGRNINQDCGSLNLNGLKNLVLTEQAHLGIAFDGDGDRVVMIDHTGETVDGDEILLILLNHYRSQGSWQGGVVGTQMTNLGLAQACQNLNVPFERTGIGDRYILQALQEKGWHLGGESSGHIICLDKNTTGDGLLAALQVLTAIQASGKDLHCLKKGMKKYPQLLINVPLLKKIDVLAMPLVKRAVTQAEAKLNNKGRILLRLSGTEPLIRVMVEGEAQALIEQVAQLIVEAIQTVIQDSQ